MRRTPSLLAALLATTVVLAGCGTDERGVDMVGDRVTAEADVTTEVCWENEPGGDSCVVVVDGEDADIVSRDPAAPGDDELDQLCHVDSSDAGAEAAPGSRPAARSPSSSSTW